MKQIVDSPSVKQKFAFNDPSDPSERGANQQCGTSNPTPHEINSSFEKEIAVVINRHSKENGSNTPDFILAAYLVDCLENFNRITSWRQKWYSPEGVPTAELIHGPK